MKITVYEMTTKPKDAQRLFHCQGLTDVFVSRGGSRGTRVVRFPSKQFYDVAEVLRILHWI